MGKIIAVVSGKGGTGKTSFTANTGLALASLGQRVLCLDCDITLRNLDLALGLSDRALMDFSDVLAQRCTLEQAVVTHRQYPTLDLLTAPMADKPLPLTVRQLAALAKEMGFDYFCTTLSISPLKDAQKINAIGQSVGEQYGVAWLPSDFKKQERYKRSIALSREYGLYRQNFCGCVYSKQEKEKPV